MNYRKIWEIRHKKRIPKGYEIHHIDGNHSNNHIDNLECLTVEEHYERHLSQGDQCVILFYDRLNITQEERIKNIELITGANNHMFGVKREDLSQRNSLSSGIKWYNNEFAEIRSFEHPGDGWKEGRLPTKKETCIKISEARKGTIPWNKNKKIGPNEYKWFTDGNIEIRSIEHPGDGWKEGRIYRERPDAREQIILFNKLNGSSVKGRKWYNNGSKNRMCFEHPGDGWKEGRLR